MVELHRVLEREGISAETLAKRVGMTLEQVYALESGNKPMKKARRIANGLNVPIYALFTDEENIQNNRCLAIIQAHDKTFTHTTLRGLKATVNRLIENPVPESGIKEAVKAAITQYGCSIEIVANYLNVSPKNFSHKSDSLSYYDLVNLAEYLNVEPWELMATPGEIASGFGLLAMIHHNGVTHTATNLVELKELVDSLR